MGEVKQRVREQREKEREKERKLTLAKLRLGHPLPDDTAGIVHHGGGLKLHGLHHIPHADL